MPALDQQTLSLHAARLPVPRYDRAEIGVGIVHFGVGGFHRAHQAMYLDRLMEQGRANDWGICGVGVMPSDRGMADAMQAQDGLYTLVEKHPDGTYEARVIGSIVRYLFAPDDPDAVLDQLSDPATRIVGLTVTEGGYDLDAVTGAFVPGPGAQRDLAGDGPPSTVFGLVTEALLRRRDAGVAPFTIMSCDNIQGNGDAARQSFSSFAALRDPGLGEWVRTHVSFPNSMVDRITPATTDDDRAEVARLFGVDDRWPVVCEPYTQWVLEDDFPAGRPALDDVGVQLVPDVLPYELMKLRLLNASHQALAYFGYLCGYRLVHEACQDPLIAGLLRDYMDDEATPTLEPLPGIDLARYKKELIERFSNGQVRDTVPRLCAESSDRIPKWLLPVVRENLASGGPVRLSAAVVASWARYAEGVDEQGDPIEVVDRLAASSRDAASRWRERPMAFLEQRGLFGGLAQDRRFADAYLQALSSLHARGARATLEDLMAPGGASGPAPVGPG